MVRTLYLDTSAVLRSVLEQGHSPDVEAKIAGADVLLTSRLSLVEAARAFSRARLLGEKPEGEIADAERSVLTLWRHCEVWELSREVCELAEMVAPATLLRSLDALQLATYTLARREIEGLELLTVDDRLRKAAEAV